MQTVNLSTIQLRAQLPTPPFFKKLRTIGLVLLAASGALAAAPIVMPAIIGQVAGYLAVAGTVLSAVSQTAVDDTTQYTVNEPSL